MTTPESSAAMTLRRELEATASVALLGQGFWNPVIVRADRIFEGVIEALFTVEVPGGKRDARLATIRTDNGLPSVIVERGWPVRVIR